MHSYHGSDYRLRVESLSTFLRAWEALGWSNSGRGSRYIRVGQAPTSPQAVSALGFRLCDYGRRLGFCGGLGNYSFGTSSVMPTWSRWLLRMPFACTILSTEEP